MKIFCNPPIISKNSKILILGSMPSVMSIEKRQYYGNPNNRFFKIMFSLFGQEYLENYEDKLALLEKNGIALFDVIKSCEREGSTDAKIKNAEVNDIPALLNKYPNIKGIVLNGSLAKKLFEKNFSDINIPLLPLPSTSPIPRKDIRSFSDLLERWKALLPFIKQAEDNDSKC